MLQSARHWVAFKGGRMLLRRGWWRGAAMLLRRATQQAPHSWEAHNNLAIAYLKLARLEEAAGMAQRAIRIAPSATDSHDVFGIALLQMNRWEEAVLAYRRAIAVDPRRYDLYDRLGMALWRLERWDEVVAAYQSALQLSAEQYSAHQRLGIALLQLGRWEEAAVAFRRAIELARKSPAAASDIAGMQMSLDTAVTQLEAARSGKRVAPPPHPGTAKHVDRGVELLTLQRWDEAAAELAKGSALSPGLGALHFLQVDPLARLGRFEEAVEAHHRAIAAGGDMPGLPASPAAARFAQRQSTFWSQENLGSHVFAIERWLEQLSAVPSRVPPGPTLLFVLDNDFGELTTVKYFLLGQELAARSTLLLPERLYAHNADSLPGRTHRYATVDDVLQAADRERPEIVFLCSAYLLREHLGFTAQELERLVDELRARGCRVVTADPYLGLLSKQDPRSVLRIEVPASHPVWTAEQLTKAKRAAEERMWEAFTESERILRDTWHLYPAYCDVAEDDVADTDARNIAFFNERLLLPPTPADPPTRPHWLFILGGPDCDMQALLHGDDFVDVAACKLVETLAAGRHPILIAPKEFIDKLLLRMPTAEGIDILPYCPFLRYMSLLLSAEQVFYWNAVSHSLLIRLFNQLPIVQFDRGHLVRIAPAIYDRIVGWYYQGWEPPFRDHRELLSLNTVDEWSADYRRQSARLVERFRRAPSPDEMVADLLHRPPIPKLEGSMRGGDVA